MLHFDALVDELAVLLHLQVIKPGRQVPHIKVAACVGPPHRSALAVEQGRIRGALGQGERPGSWVGIRRRAGRLAELGAIRKVGASPAELLVVVAPQVLVAVTVNEANSLGGVPVLMRNG